MRNEKLFFNKIIVDEKLMNIALYDENTNCPCKVIDICPITNNNCK